MILSSLELKKHLVDNDVILIDVREPVEYNIEHIEGALLLPLSSLTLSNLPTVSKKIVFYCAAGIRSHKACVKILQEDDSIDVSTLEGGIQAWKQAGLPVISPACKKILPIQQQTQIFAAILLSISLMIGYGYHPYGFLLSGLVAVGLMMSGLTGWCGSAKILSKMPWNNR